MRFTVVLLPVVVLVLFDAVVGTCIILKKLFASMTHDLV